MHAYIYIYIYVDTDIDIDIDIDEFSGLHGHMEPQGLGGIRILRNAKEL